jgi:hypothetical protein
VVPSPLRVRFDTPLAGPMAWALDLFCRDAELDWVAVPPGTEAEWTVGEDPAADWPLGPALREAFAGGGPFGAERLFPDEPVLRAADGRVDVLGTAFCLVNGVTEWGHPARDAHGRLPFSASVQARHPAALGDLVGDLFREAHTRLLPGRTWPGRPSLLFVSHDVDRVWHGWKDDGKAALRAGRPDRFLALAWRRAFGLPAELDLAGLQARNAALGVPGTFFLLPRRARPGEHPPDADHDLRQPRVARQIAALAARPDVTLGLHKPAHAGFGDALRALGRPARANRNHFLRFRLPEHYREATAAGLELDSSLAFSERPGWRTAYARPFRPWDAETGRALPLLEVPFAFMDTTFEHYGGGGPEGALDAGRALLRAHAGRGAVLGMLWHNDYLAGGAGRRYAPVYRALVTEALAAGYRPVDAGGLMDAFGRRPDPALPVTTHA